MRFQAVQHIGHRVLFAAGNRYPLKGSPYPAGFIRISTFNRFISSVLHDLKRIFYFMLGVAQFLWQSENITPRGCCPDAFQGVHSAFQCHRQVLQCLTGIQASLFFSRRQTFCGFRADQHRLHAALHHLNGRCQHAAVFRAFQFTQRALQAFHRRFQFRSQIIKVLTVSAALPDKFIHGGKDAFTGLLIQQQTESLNINSLCRLFSRCHYGRRHSGEFLCSGRAFCHRCHYSLQ
ncbi:Uncharacterised protein [Serratia quinivorans]|nr:Uncharacterised protein [Serratia quinivorans]